MCISAEELTDGTYPQFRIDHAVLLPREHTETANRMESRAAVVFQVLYKNTERLGTREGR